MRKGSPGTACRPLERGRKREKERGERGREREREREREGMKEESDVC